VALALEDKKAIVAELTEVVGNSVSAVAADYCGLTVSEMTELRVKARDVGVKMRVYRNTLARRAIEGTEFACLKEVLVGPVVLLFSVEEPGAAAKILRDFIKVHKALEVRALVMSGALLSADQLDAVASLPTLEEALAKLVFVMKAPVTQFVRTVKEPVAQLVRAVAAVRDKKQAA
jgi:large subunit ribosomal protein L10